MARAEQSPPFAPPIPSANVVASISQEEEKQKFDDKQINLEVKDQARESTAVTGHRSEHSTLATRR